MNADLKAQELTRNIQNAKVRDKTFAFLRDMLSNLEQIDDFDEDAQYRNNERDGIPVVSINSVTHKQKERLENLRNLTSGMDDENEELLTVVVEPEIDRRRAYGYTRIMQAVVEHDIQTVKNCLTLGANRFIPDNGGNTCEEKARKLGFDDLVEILQAD